MFDITCWFSLLLGWYYSVVNITFWLTFLSCWHYILVDITFCFTLLFVNITFWLTLLFGWHYILVDITFYLILLFCIVLKFHCWWWWWGGVVLIQLPCDPNLGLDWKLGCHKNKLGSVGLSYVGLGKIELVGVLVDIVFG